MKRSDALLLLVVLVLGLGSAVEAARIARHYERGGSLRVEVGRERITTLTPATKERLDRLESRVAVTYYVSGAEHMPSHMRRVERSVTDMLEAMAARAPERFDFQIVDPERDPDLVGFSSRRRVSPFRVRSVTRDGWTEKNVWSALTIEYGGSRGAQISGVGPEHLPRLQATIVEHLDRLEAPRTPVLALAAPPGFGELADGLAQRGELVGVDLDGGAPFPTAADVLLWMAPRVVTPRRLVELERFLADGGSVVVAGSELFLGADGLLDAGDGTPAVRVTRSGYPAEALLSPFGLRPVPGIVLDRRSDSVAFGGETVEAPFLVRCIAPNQDFESWRSQPNGTLLFTTPTPIALVPPVLEELGLFPRVLATTSDATWIQEAPVDAPLPFAAMREEDGTPAAKQALIVACEPNDPWRGRIVFVAGTTPFEDGLFTREGAAHRRLLDALLDELASEERLVVRGAGAPRAEPIPALSAGERLFWRGLCVGLAPLVLALAALRRRRAPKGATRERAAGAIPWRALAALPLILVLVRAADMLAWKADATTDDLNRLAPGTEDVAAEAGQGGPIRAELLFSDPRRLPPALRRPAERLAELVDSLTDAGAALDVTRTDPADLDDGEREALLAEGIEPFRLAVEDGDVTRVHTIWAALRLTRGERVEILRFSDERSFEDLEFRLAFVLWRITTGRRLHVAFASDVPRPSSAEAYEYYQQKGLFSPKGVDVYSVARETLEGAGYRVTHVNPRAPEIPPDADLLVWLQPRRSIERMLPEALRYLHGGGRVLLAAQHFNVQRRQYRGAGFDVVHWPQPQSPDVERMYFPEVGIELVREVLFDERMTRSAIDSRITGRSSHRDFERQESALPFQIRAAAASFDADSPVTRYLGDQAFLGASFLRWDEARLDELGITARPLIRTSERSWTFDWKGSWLPHEVLAGPPVDEAGDPQWTGRLPLAVMFEGVFPEPVAPLFLNPDMAAQEKGATADEERPWPAPAPGRLLFVGCSELFKDHRITAEEFRGDHLLLNAVAELTLAPELVDVATRRAVPRGFDWVAPERRLQWRVAVIAAGPVGMLVLGAALALARRRRPALPRPGGAA